ncbi:hypothetical protein Ppa06_70480 [Planomonospora parontospora subsp. parontospora]|uniref:Uncharacterized protein n=2 Tax=Planomonospora parontospora TaxID=58119 RepID=A0AA37BPF0_9ACTN|nr:hypothetical protein GCM10010126_71080 [Planomonospora parontospora]GII13250.1 hypothetical protein Ppa06_70480 [Planomonospora parontospora subsp. parontospora]
MPHDLTSDTGQADAIRIAILVRRFDGINEQIINEQIIQVQMPAPHPIEEG